MQEHRPFLPYGFQFNPSDEELLQHYLKNKVFGTLNKLIPFVDYFIWECDLYEKNPSEIWTSHGGSFLKHNEDLYFFTPLKKKTSKGSRINRKVTSSGTWKNQHAAEEIEASESQEILGSKKTYRYENKGSEDHGAWIMHEYTLDPSMLPQNRATNYVLCRLRKKCTEKQEKLSLPMKRKLTGVQNNQSEDELDKLLNSVECKSGSSMSAEKMAQDTAYCCTNMSAQVERKETGGSCDIQNADEQYGMPNNMILSSHQCVPYDRIEATGGVNYSFNIYEVGQQNDVLIPNPDQTVETLSMLQQENSGIDPLHGVTDKDLCSHGQTFPGTYCEDALVTVVEQESRCDTSSMAISEQRLSANYGLYIGGMDSSYSSSVAEQQPEAAFNWPDQMIQWADRNLTPQVNNQLIGINILEDESEAVNAMIREYEQISSDNPSALENGILETQGTGGIVDEVPMEVVDEMLLQSQNIVQYEEWSDSDLLVGLTEEGDIKFG